MSEQNAGAAAQVRDLFDAKAATWATKYAPGGRLTGRLAQFATAVQRAVPPGYSVLDLGCGTGDLARHLACAGQRVTGCDISAEMLQRAMQADSAGAVEWARLDPGWQRLPFADATFGAVVTSSVLEYVDDPLVVLRECARILQPGGTLLCTVPDLRHPVRWLEWLASLGTRTSPPWTNVRNRPRLGSYLTYLRISQQRHSARWWKAAGERAALRIVPTPGSEVIPGPLRLLIFQLPGATVSAL